MELTDVAADIQIDSLLGATILPATAVSAGCVIATESLNDVVTYLRAGEMQPEDLRRTSALLLGLSMQLALHASAIERERVRNSTSHPPTV